MYREVRVEIRYMKEKGLGKDKGEEAYDIVTTRRELKD